MENNEQQALASMDLDVPDPPEPAYDSLEEGPETEELIISQFSFVNGNEWFSVKMVRPATVRRRDAFMQLCCSGMTPKERAIAYLSAFGGSMQDAQAKTRFGPNHGRPFSHDVLESIRLLSNTHVPQTVAPKMDERAKKSALQSQRRRHLRKFRERVSQVLTAYGVFSR